MSNSWSQLASLPMAREAHTTTSANGSMYVLGGFMGSSVTDTVLKFDATQGTWTETARMPIEARCHLALGFEKHIFVFGGLNDSDQMQSGVFKYDTEVDVWTNLAAMPHATS